MCSHDSSPAHTPCAWRTYLPACTCLRFKRVITAAVALTAVLFMNSAYAQPRFEIKAITWDVIGLDSNKPSTDGPVDFPLAVRVKYIGAVPANNVVVKAVLGPGGNPNVNLDNLDELTKATMAPNEVADFYFNIKITTPTLNNEPGFFSIIGNSATTKLYKVTVSADGVPAKSTPDNRQLFVEKILSQNRNSVAPTLEVDNPELPFFAGQTRMFTLKSETATGYDQQETSINFPNDIFQVVAVKAVYDEPANGEILQNETQFVAPFDPLVKTTGKFTTNKVYVDGCGWVTDFTDTDNYMTSNNSCTNNPMIMESQTGKIGGKIETLFVVKVVQNIIEPVHLDYLVHDHSGSSFHYNFMEDIFTIIPTNIKVTKTAPATVEVNTNFNYTIVVENTSTEAADNVVLTDSLPPCVSFVSADPAPVDAGANPLAWNLGTLAAGASRTFTVVAKSGCTEGNCKNEAEVATTDIETNYADNKDDATVDIQDTTLPIITCPGNKTLDCPADTTVPTNGTATATDNCPGVVVTSSDKFTPACGNTGTLVRTWKATDAAGNMATCDQTITVRDNTPPTLTVPADKTLDCPSGTGTDITGVATATDTCDASVIPTFTDKTTAGCGATKVVVRTWTAKDDCGNEVSKDQTITVRDNTPPTLTVPVDKTLDCPSGTGTDITGVATATDTCDASVIPTFTDKTTAGCGATKVIVRTWTAKDDCGNEVSKDQTITVRDNTAPSVTCPADINLPPPVAPATCSQADYPTITATDACDNNVTITFDPPEAEACFPCGTTNVVTVTAEDDCGNKSTCTFNVIVADCPDGCSLTQGFWKNHPEDWPVESLTLGTVPYTKAQCIQILQTPVKKNGLVALAHQLIAAKLNVIENADSSCISTYITQADALIGDLSIPSVGNGKLTTKQASFLNNVLDDFNNGRLCAPHCDDVEPDPVTFKIF